MTQGRGNELAGKAQGRKNKPSKQFVTGSFRICHRYSEQSAKRAMTQFGKPLRKLSAGYGLIDGLIVCVGLRGF